MRKPLVALMFAAMATSGLAQSRSSFLQVDAFEDLMLTVSNGGLTYNLQLGAAPKMWVGGTSYDVTGVFGVWALSNDDDLVAVNADNGVWGAHQNQSGTGGIAGWKTNPPNALHANQSMSWTFTSLNTASVEQQGFHIMTAGSWPGGGGNTGYATVPEPSGWLALLVCIPIVLAGKSRRR